MQDPIFEHPTSEVTATATSPTTATLLQPFADNPLAILPIVCAVPALVLVLSAVSNSLYRKYVFNRQVTRLLQVISLERLLYLESDRHC